MAELNQQILTELLVTRCQQGDKNAFADIVEIWQKPLLSFALRYLDNEAAAQDAVQDTWVSVISGIGQLRNPSLFTSWLFRILANKCIDRLQRKSIETKNVKQDNTAQSATETKHDSNLLIRAIGRLTVEHRNIIVLRFGQGLQIQQIAGILNITEGTVKSRLHRAIRNLRELLGDNI